MKRHRPSSLKFQPSTSGREREQSDRFDVLIHDLRNCFSAIRFAQYLLDDTHGLGPHEDNPYKAILRSNLSHATRLLEDLLQVPPYKNSSNHTMTALLTHLSGQLPETVASESEDQLAHLKKLVEIGLQGT